VMTFSASHSHLTSAFPSSLLWPIPFSESSWPALGPLQPLNRYRS
jgi:hypothetical protein